ncbi:hypothetical protein D3C81_554220 [compost metagenome]|uniref:hypothetical protein n=1 Tax=Acinetobacter calcoaceticus TaxID=471 RepID=UPI0001BB5399|nr:hypothetical protein [Acinetobacter calcoaceticus]EEY76956.1 hypothetical protein HMPREF0012_02396 [Acinetobacter calcoaceticus RUH2202]
MLMLKKLSLLTISFISINAFADDSNIVNEAEALAVDAKSYAASYNVPFDEAVRRLLIMHGTSSEISNIRNNVKGDLQGLYFTNGKNNFGLNVNVANYPKTLPRSLNIAPRSSTAIQNIIRSSGNLALRKQFNITDTDMKTVAIQYSQPVTAPIHFNKQSYPTKLQRLNNIENKRKQLKAALPLMHQAYDDERTGNTKIFVTADNGSTKKIAESILNTPVEIIISPRSTRVATRGGSPLLALEPQSVQGQIACFSGFIGKRNGVLGIITAGHCAKVGELSRYQYKDRDGTQYVIPLLTGASPTSGWRDDSVADLGFLPAGTTSTQLAKAEFYADSSVNFRKLTATKTRSGTAWDNGTVNGSYICHLGKTGGYATTLTQSCGEVESINSGNADNVGNTFVRVKNTNGSAGSTHTTGLGSLRCYHGDSGSPWFALTTGYGITHSCEWQTEGNDTTPALYAIYTSLDYLSTIGTTIVIQ